MQNTKKNAGLVVSLLFLTLIGSSAWAMGCDTFLRNGTIEEGERAFDFRWRTYPYGKDHGTISADELHLLLRNLFSSAPFSEAKSVRYDDKNATLVFHDNDRDIEFKPVDKNVKYETQFASYKRNHNAFHIRLYAPGKVLTLLFGVGGNFFQANLKIKANWSVSSFSLPRTTQAVVTDEYSARTRVFFDSSFPKEKGFFRVRTPAER